MCILGSLYNLIFQDFEMTDETRKTLEILYEQTNLTKNILGIIRNMIFILSTRIGVNYIQQPDETVQELRSFTIKEFQDRILSTGYQNTVAVRAYYRIIWILLGASVLKQLGDSRAKANQKLGRTMNYIESKVLFEDYVQKLNYQIESFESCHKP